MENVQLRFWDCLRECIDPGIVVDPHWDGGMVLVCPGGSHVFFFLHEKEFPFVCFVQWKKWRFPKIKVPQNGW